MKLLLIFILIFPLYLLGSKEKPSQEYTLGLQYYKQNNFTKSYAIFKKVYLQHLSDIEFNFYFGRSAYETGDYTMALAAFERVEIQDSSNLRNRLEMARTYYMLKMYEDAESAFRDVLENPDIPQNIRRDIELSLSKVSKVQKKSFTYARAMLNILFDSNVNYGSIADYQYGGGILSKIDAQADGAAELHANVTNIYDIGQKNGFAFKNSLSLYAKEYFTESDFSTLSLTYTPSFLYKETKYTFETAVGFGIMYIGGSKYMQNFYTLTSLQYMHTATLSSLAHLKYQVNKFLQASQEELNASRLEFAYGLQKNLSPRSYLQGNILYIKEAKERGTNIYVNFDAYKGNLSYVNQFTNRYSINLYTQVLYRDYKDYSIGFNSHRKDIGGEVSAHLTISLLPTWSANIKTGYEYIDSNQDRFTYQKYILSAGLNKTF